MFHVCRDLLREEVIEALQQRTLAAMNESWRLEKRVPALEATVESLQKRIATQEGELVKGASVRDRLQDLCRELQKQNREVRLYTV